MMPRDNATQGEALVTVKAEIPAHQGASECSARAPSTAKVTDAAASAASRPRGPCNCSERSSVASALGISRSIQPASIDDQGARVGAHVQDNARVGVLQYQCHRKAPFQADPIGRRLHIGQQLAVCRQAADPAGNALDTRAMNMPGIGVEPNPGGMTYRHMTDHAFFIVSVNPPGKRVDQPKQGL